MPGQFDRHDKPVNLHPELVREILLEIERETTGEPIQVFRYAGYDPVVVAEHLRLLIESGYIEGELVGEIGNSDCEYGFPRVTQHGQEFSFLRFSFGSTSSGFADGTDALPAALAIATLTSGDFSVGALDGSFPGSTGNMSASLTEVAFALSGPVGPTPAPPAFPTNTSAPAVPGVRIDTHGGNSFFTTRAKIPLAISTSGQVTSVTASVGRKALAVTARGPLSRGRPLWSLKAALKPGKNKITVIAHGPGGASAPAKVTVTRKP